MWDFVSKLFDTSDFPARWHCGNWTAGHGWLHIVSDLAVWGAYTAIPCVLIYFVWRRRDIPFPRIFWLFGAFILACGTGHLIEAGIFWWPWYRFSGVVKAFTAIVSWTTVVALVPIVPKALALPGLVQANAELERQIAERRRVESALVQKAEELAKVNRDLQRFNRLALGREDRILELKREVNELATRLGESTRYAAV